APGVHRHEPKRRVRVDERRLALHVETARAHEGHSALPDGLAERCPQSLVVDDPAVRFVLRVSLLSSWDIGYWHDLDLPVDAAPLGTLWPGTLRIPRAIVMVSPPRARRNIGPRG